MGDATKRGFFLRKFRRKWESGWYVLACMLIPVQFDFIETFFPSTSVASSPSSFHHLPVKPIEEG